MFNLAFTESHKRKTFEYPLKSKNVSVKRPPNRDSKHARAKNSRELKC